VLADKPETTGGTKSKIRGIIKVCRWTGRLQLCEDELGKVRAKYGKLPRKHVMSSILDAYSSQYQDIKDISHINPRGETIVPMAIQFP
jgi:hypothetical protein